jgi:integrase
MAKAQRAAYGAGSMTEKAPGVWRLRAMSNGRQVERTFRGTEAAARKHLRTITDEPEVEQPAPTDGRTFLDLLTKWLDNARTVRGAEWAPNTVHSNRRAVETRIGPRLGAIPVADLDAETLDAAYSAWLAEGLAPSSVHRLAATISSALTQGVKWGWIPASPVAASTPPTAAPSRQSVALDPEQVGQLIHTAEAEGDPIMAAAVALAYVTGARRGELCALRWSDVDLDAGTVRVERSLTDLGPEPTVKGTKTGRGRTIGLDARSVAILRRHRAWQADLAARAESPLVADPYVLSDNANAGRPLKPSKVTDRFTKLRKAAGIRKGATFHSLRHGSVTQLLAAGVDPVTVAARAGHSSTRMTLDRYAHALPAGDAGAAAIMGGLLPE